MVVLTFVFSDDSGDWGGEPLHSTDNLKLYGRKTRTKTITIDDDLVERVVRSFKKTDNGLLNVFVELGVSAWYLNRSLIYTPPLITRHLKIIKDEQLMKRLERTRKRLSKAEIRAKRRKAQKRRMKGRVVKDNNPDPTPLTIYSNISLNSGGNCVENLIGEKINTVGEIVDYQRKNKYNCILFNILGQPIDYSMKFKPSKNDLFALISNEHIYPAGDPFLKPIGTPVRQPFSPSLAQTTDSIRDFISNITPLYYSNEIQGTTYDHKEMYYNVAITPFTYGVPCVYDSVKVYKNQKLRSFDTVNVRCKRLRELGYSYSVMSYEESEWVKKFFPIKITHFLKFKNTECTSKIAEKIKKFYDKIPEDFEPDDEDREKNYRKKLRIAIGICGKQMRKTFIPIKNINKEEFEDIEEENREYLNDDFYYRVVNNYSNKNSFRYGIVSQSNVVMLKEMWRVMQKYKCLPTKINTDSLTYTKKVKYSNNWKPETFKFISGSSPHTYYKQLVYPEFENITHIGDPGGGKSTKAKTHDYDIPLAYTNQRARDINGRTITSMLSTGNYEHFRGLTLWVDEFTLVPKKYWGIFLTLYYEFDVRFIFTGDFNQLPPHGEDMMDTCAFLGEIEELTDQWRMSPKMYEVYKKLEDFKPVFEDNQNYPPVNLCFFLKTKALGNSKLNDDWFKIGTKMRSKVNSKKMGVINGEVLTIKSMTLDDKEITETRERERGIIVSFEETDKIITMSELTLHFDYANFMTVDSSQGSEFNITEHPSIGIHDWDRMDIRRKRVAFSRGQELTQLKFYKT